MTDSEYHGIGISGGDNNLIDGNIFVNNDAYGVDIAAGCNYNRVFDNILSGNGSGPINDASGTAILPTISGDFPLSNVGGGAAAIAPVINTSPGGIDVD
ncbi:unnamed protein product, partial [marine sediment metagenome]